MKKVIYFKGDRRFTAIKTLDGDLIGLIASKGQLPHLDGATVELYREKELKDCSSYLGAVRWAAAKMKQIGWRWVPRHRARKLLVMK